MTMVFLLMLLMRMDYKLSFNYFAHKDGKPANVPLLNFIAPGEGWHKNHHDKPMSIKLHKYDIAGFIIERIFTKSKFSS